MTTIPPLGRGGCLKSSGDQSALDPTTEGLDVPVQWWAHLVGALQVHPHQHYANYPPQKDRGALSISGHLADISEDGPGAGAEYAQGDGYYSGRELADAGRDET